MTLKDTWYSHLKNLFVAYLSKWNFRQYVKQPNDCIFVHTRWKLSTNWSHLMRLCIVVGFSNVLDTTKVYWTVSSFRLKPGFIRTVMLILRLCDTGRPRILISFLKRLCILKKRCVVWHISTPNCGTTVFWLYGKCRYLSRFAFLFVSLLEENVRFAWL